MSQQTINTGASLGDHTGDDGRTAFGKVNANFTELYANAANQVLYGGGVGTAPSSDSGFTYSATNKAVTLGGATVTTSNPVLDLSQTWNAGGVTFTGLKFNVTDTASASATLLTDLQVGGTSKFKVRKDGNVMIGGGGSGGAELGVDGLVVQGKGYFSQYGAQMASGATVQWSSNASTYSGGDTILLRDAANTLALRNGTNAQTFRAYNTYTDASNGEWAELAWSSNVCYARANKNGTGSARLFVPVTGSTTFAGLPSAATAGAGARSFITDASATTFLSTAAGGGANKVPVVSDGSAWLIG